VDEIGPQIGSGRCPRSRQSLLCLETGQVIPARCRASFCEYCGPIQAWWKARIISDGGGAPPERYWVLSQAPEDWDKLRQKMRDFRRLMRARGYAWEHAWTVEVGEKTGMIHVNALQKGDFVPQAIGQDSWGSIVHVQAIKRSPSNVAGYALKEAARVAGYSLKEGGTAEKLQGHLERNGGRLVHLSRQYLGGLTQEQVQRTLVDRQREQEPQTWVLIPR
jgi:hypothetical protein